MTDQDGFDDLFPGFDRSVDGEAEGPWLDESVFGGIDQLEGPRHRNIDDELILGEDYVTYLMFEPSKRTEAFSAASSGFGLVVTSGDLNVARYLGVRVETDEQSASFRNGVLCVRLRRIRERDGGA